MKYLTTLVGLMAVAVAAFAVASPATGGVAAASCSQGQTKYGGAAAYAYCGPARATLTLGGRTVTYRGGSCRRTPKSVELNIGIAVLGDTDKSLPRHCGVIVGQLYGVGTPARRDGKYTDATIAFVEGGKRYAATSSSVVLSGSRTKGTFTATLFGGKAATGTFRCS